MKKVTLPLFLTLIISIAQSNPTEYVEAYKWLPLEEDEESISTFYFDPENNDNPKELWLRIDYKKGFGGEFSRSISYDKLDCEKAEIQPENYTLFGKKGGVEVVPANKESFSLADEVDNSDELLYKTVCGK